MSGAKKILERKPEGGYISLDQVKELNHDLKRVRWEVLAPIFRFDTSIESVAPIVE
jgi:hypothetical protein